MYKLEIIFPLKTEKPYMRHTCYQLLQEYDAKRDEILKTHTHIWIVCKQAYTINSHYIIGNILPTSFPGWIYNPATQHCVCGPIKVTTHLHIYGFQNFSDATPDEIRCKTFYVSTTDTLHDLRILIQTSEYICENEYTIDCFFLDNHVLDDSAGIWATVKYDKQNHWKININVIYGVEPLL